MGYLLHWTCKVCGRKQSTRIERGAYWPTLCDQCVAEFKEQYRAEV